MTLPISFYLVTGLSAVSGVAPSTVFAQKPIDWKAADTETAAKYQSILELEGIPTKLVGANPQRLSLIATLNGNGTKKPILIMGHTDVVDVQRERWTEDPFEAALIDGYI
jgi:acetylornithine deacetylase/succinyl-diaminopimelate desuccinylase-like protein